MDVRRRSAREQKQAAHDAGYTRIVWHLHDDGLAAYVPFAEVEAGTATYRGAVEEVGRIEADLRHAVSSGDPEWIRRQAQAAVDALDALLRGQ